MNALFALSQVPFEYPAAYFLIAVNGRGEEGRLWRILAVVRAVHLDSPSMRVWSYLLLRCTPKHACRAGELASVRGNDHSG